MNEHKVRIQPLIKEINHIAILCSNKEASIAFYETLDFHVREKHIRPERSDEILYMENNGILLELFVSTNHPVRVSNPEAYGMRHLAFTVSSIGTVYDELKEAGYQPEPFRHDTYNGALIFFVKDPDGLPIELHE